MEAKELSQAPGSRGSRRGVQSAKVGNGTMSLTDGTMGGGGFNMKAKIQALEQGSKVHDEEFERVYQQLDATNVTVKENDQTCHELFKKNDERITTEITAVKDEMVHRFTLQTAENKRLQNHITNLKQENQALERRLFALEERVKHLEIEVGGEDGEQHEFGGDEF